MVFGIIKKNWCDGGSGVVVVVTVIVVTVVGGEEGGLVCGDWIVWGCGV